MKTKLSLPIVNKRDNSHLNQKSVIDSETLPGLSDDNLRSLEDACLIEILSLGDSNAFRIELERNCDVLNAVDTHGLTLLMHSVCIKMKSSLVIDNCRELIDQKVDINAVDTEGYSVLHWAAACSEPAVLKFICTIAGIDGTRRGHDGETPLHRSCRLGRSENAGVLIQHFPDMAFQCNNEHQLPIEVAGLWLGRLNLSFRESIRRRLGCSFFPTFGTEVIYHHDCMLHLPRGSGSQGDQPWESPDRLSAIMGSLRRLDNDSLLQLITEFPSATDDQILRCHSVEYLDFLYSLDLAVQEHQFPVPFTPAVQRSITKLPLERTKSSSLSDTSYSSGTLTAARRACGAVLKAASDVLDGRCRNAFCAVRPPGHHVGFNGPIVDSQCGSCGFSILNSVMVAAMDIVEKYGKRVAVLDLDAHHGNGTENIVNTLNRPNDLMFVSIHLYDGRFYPASGGESDLTRNIHNVPISPLWSGSDNGRTAWIEGVRNRMVPLVSAFRPDIILISMGFDGAGGDVGNGKHEIGHVSQVGLDLQPSDFSAITDEICRLSNILCCGRTVSVLEGGYGKFQWTEVHRTASDVSTHAGSDDSSVASSGLRNGRKRAKPFTSHTQVINRQPLANSVLHHVKALMGTSAN